MIKVLDIIPSKTIPFEIYKIIFSNITDNITYCNVRISCKMFYETLKDLKIYRKNQLIKIIIFNDYIINILNNKNQEIGFYNKQSNIFKLTENNEIINIDLSNPYKIITTKKNLFNYQTITNNLITDKKENKTINFPPMCTIS